MPPGCELGDDEIGSSTAELVIVGGSVISGTEDEREEEGGGGSRIELMPPPMTEVRVSIMPPLRDDVGSGSGADVITADEDADGVSGSSTALEGAEDAEELGGAGRRIEVTSPMTDVTPPSADVIGSRMPPPRVVVGVADEVDSASETAVVLDSLADVGGVDGVDSTSDELEGCTDEDVDTGGGGNNMDVTSPITDVMPPSPEVIGSRIPPPRVVDGSIDDEVEMELLEVKEALDSDEDGSWLLVDEETELEDTEDIEGDTLGVESEADDETTELEETDEMETDDDGVDDDVSDVVGSTDVGGRMAVTSGNDEGELILGGEGSSSSSSLPRIDETTLATDPQIQSPSFLFIERKKDTHASSSQD
ncbi:hypothetical protein PC9H_011066 [Pleurotus ostreatus]|uniref:Uncharacterized protein n=1 Tax=Pleurotus ostreatus TaxID=5322 RepID=A0A8H6ZST9_PLEOS|nr:uncharacterized protein PC9H_011066 [Pleurotus ostreatus]KAF7422902.1 hypothetical protein PC9H_011066 [Pleurotus ostreatus]